MFKTDTIFIQIKHRTIYNTEFQLNHKQFQVDLYIFNVKETFKIIEN